MWGSLIEYISLIVKPLDMAKWVSNALFLGVIEPVKSCPIWEPFRKIPNAAPPGSHSHKSTTSEAMVLLKNDKSI